MRRDGFILVELLIVIAILGILVAMDFLGVRAYTAKAYNITVKHDEFVKSHDGDDEARSSRGKARES